MPKIKSAKKALRQNIKRREQNLQRKKQLQAVIKNFKKLVVTEKNPPAGGEAQKYLATLYKTIDKMAKVNLIKKNKSNRLKSRLSKKSNSN